jgi:hypothetical protein
VSAFSAPSAPERRVTFARKLEGLTPEQLRRRSVEPSSLSLLGLARHLAEVERSWWRARVAGEDAPPLTYSDDDPDGDFDGVDDADPAADLAWLAQEQAHARRVLAGRALDDTWEHPSRGTVSVRWVLTHLLEEYARHNGHADLLRERIDGATGE